MLQLNYYNVTKMTLLHAENVIRLILMIISLVLYFYEYIFPKLLEIEFLIFTYFLIFA